MGGGDARAGGMGCYGGRDGVLWWVGRGFHGVMVGGVYLNYGGCYGVLWWVI